MHSKKISLNFQTLIIPLHQVYVLLSRNFFITFERVLRVLSLKMNGEAKTWFYPAQVFAQFTSGDEKPVKFVDKQENSEKNVTNTSKNKGFSSDIIQIFETGELTIAPDYAQVIIVCTSIKVM